jgi:hypothetical protein
MTTTDELDLDPELDIDDPGIEEPYDDEPVEDPEAEDDIVNGVDDDLDDGLPLEDESGPRR